MFITFKKRTYKIFPFYKMWTLNEVARTTKDDLFIQIFNQTLKVNLV